MNVRLAGTIGVWIVACVMLTAADFWEDKDFTTWSDREVEKVLTDSPWSRKVTVAILGPTGGGGGRGGRGGGGGGGGFGGGGGDGDGRGRSGSDGFDLAARRLRMTLTVSWRSALPVKQALVRGRIGVDAKIPQEQQQFLMRDETFYVVAASGFPRRFSRLARNPAALAARAILKRKGKDQISAEDSRVSVENEETVVIAWFFPRADAITLNDKDVEFVAELGPIEIKKKFKLKDMLFGNQLAL